MNYSELEKYISSDRLSSYFALTGRTDLEGAIGAYSWNKALGGSIYPFLQCLEVTLRNSVHIEGRKKFARETWYENLCQKVGTTVRNKQRKNGRPETLTTNEYKIKEAIDKLKKGRKIVSASNVIASLSLGFWVNLFRRDYSSANKSLLWPESLPLILPNAPNSRLSLDKIYDELTEINLLRNRFSHHEPLWKSNGTRDIDDAIQFIEFEVAKIVEYVEFISPDRAKMLKGSLAFEDFHRFNTKDVFSMFLAGSQR